MNETGENCCGVKNQLIPLISGGWEGFLNLKYNNKNMKKTFYIEWMHCASCSNLIQSSLDKKLHINKISVNIWTNSAKIDYDEEKISFKEIKKEINDLWFRVVLKLKQDFT